MASVAPTPPRAPSCRSCAATLVRCWVCTDLARCADCQQCLRCEGLLDEAVVGRMRTPDLPVSVPAVRLKRPDRATAGARPRAPAPEPTPEKKAATATQRLRAKRAPLPRAPSLQHSHTADDLANAIWYIRAAITPLLMLAGGYGAYTYFHNYSGLALATMCVVGFYFPYVVLTPVRRKGDFFPLGDEGPALPIGMVIGGAIIGMIAGIVLGIFLGEWVGRWGGIAVAMITFHGIYYITVSESAVKHK